jgi:uncharacterized membrane protein affecting hemolysin expression
MDVAEVCAQIAQQFDHTAQSHLAILGTIAVNVIMLIRVWMTSRSTNIQSKENAQQLASVKRSLNGG